MSDNRVVKSTVVYLSIGNKTYKYTEKLEVVSEKPILYVDLTDEQSAQPTEYIDLTAEDVPEVSRSESRNTIPRTNSPTFSDYCNSSYRAYSPDTSSYSP